MNWIQLLERQTADLVAQRLRSDAVVVAHLAELIDQAVGFGHPHRAIHEALRAGGLGANWNSYRVALRRARKARRAGTPPPGAHALDALAEHPRMLTSAAAVIAPTAAPSSPASGTEFAAALRRAQRNAERDYGHLARDHLRRQAQAVASTEEHP